MYDVSFKSAGDYDLLLRPGKNLKAGYTNTITTSMAMGGVSNKDSRALKEHYLVIIKNVHTPRILAYLSFVKKMLIWKIKQRLH